MFPPPAPRGACVSSRRGRGGARRGRYLGGGARDDAEIAEGAEGAERLASEAKRGQRRQIRKAAQLSRAGAPQLLRRTGRVHGAPRALEVWYLAVSEA